MEGFGAMKTSQSPLLASGASWRYQAASGLFWRGFPGIRPRVMGVWTSGRHLPDICFKTENQCGR